MANEPHKRHRRRAIPETEWERIRPHFEHLYIDSDLPLHEVSATLKRDHDFHAELHMLKTRIAKWNLKKNFKKEELEAVAMIARPFVQARLKVPTAVIGGRKVPIDRPRRHFRASFQSSTRSRNQTFSLQYRSGSISHIDACQKHPSTNGPDNRGLVPVPRVRLQHSDEMYGLESTMVHVYNYYGWRLTQRDDFFQRQSQDTMTCLVRPKNLNIKARDALLALDQGDIDMTKAYSDEFCELAPAVFRQQHPTLVIEVFTFIDIIFQDAIDIIALYLAATSKKILGVNHPIAMLLQLIVRIKKDRHVSAQTLPILQLLYEAAKEQFGPYSQTALDVEITISELVLYNNDFWSASVYFDGQLTRFKATLGENSTIYCRTLEDYGLLHYFYGFDDAAEEILSRVIELSSHCDLEVWDLFIQAESMAVLGYICESRQDFRGALHRFLQAYECGRHYRGPHRPHPYRLHRSILQAQARLDQEEGLSDSISKTLLEAGENEIDAADGLAKLLQEISLLEQGETGRAALNDGPGNVWDADGCAPSCARDTSLDQSMEALATPTEVSSPGGWHGDGAGITTSHIADSDPQEAAIMFDADGVLVPEDITNVFTGDVEQYSTALPSFDTDFDLSQLSDFNLSFMTDTAGDVEVEPPPIGMNGDFFDLTDNGFLDEDLSWAVEGWIHDELPDPFRA